jgi:hypothetical protein
VAALAYQAGLEKATSDFVTEIRPRIGSNAQAHALAARHQVFKYKRVAGAKSTSSAY